MNRLNTNLSTKRAERNMLNKQLRSAEGMLGMSGLRQDQDSSTKP